MKKKLILLLAALMLVSLTLAGCGGTTADDDTFRVGIVYSTGGLGDRSFNDSAHRGLQQARDELGIHFDYVEPRESAEDDAALRDFAERGYDLVIGVGFQMAKTLAEVAADYPDVKFAIVDGGLAQVPANVVDLVFAEHQGSFLAGAIAALVSESNTIGFIGGVSFGLIHRFEGGFVAGAKHINPDIRVISNYAASFGDPGTGKELALAQINQGADVIYHASGGTGGGLFEAVMEIQDRTVYAIGVDANQNWLAPGRVIASMLKRVDVAVFEIVNAALEGTYAGGQAKVFDLEIDGVGLTDLEEIDVDEQAARTANAITEAELEAIREMKENVTAEHAAAIEEIKAGILNGTIQVPDWMIDGRP